MYLSGEWPGGGGAKDGPKTTDPAEEERRKKHCQGYQRGITGKTPTCSSIHTCLSALSVSLPMYLSRWRMDLLQLMTVRCQEMRCSVPSAVTAPIYCYVNTVCLLPSTHTQRPPATSRATGSTGAWLQGPVKVVVDASPLLVSV